MHLFLTSVLPFLAHNHASAAAFLTCRHHNFHASIIPEFLSDEERVISFYRARQHKQSRGNQIKQYEKLYDLFVQTPLMQFSPSLIVSQVASILKPLLQTKYFARSLQRCSVVNYEFSITNEFLQALSKVQSLTKLDLGENKVENRHLEIIVNSFPGLEILTMQNASSIEVFQFNPTEPAVKVSSPPPAATKTLRSLTLKYTEAMFVTQFVPYFSNLRKLTLHSRMSYQELDVLHLSSSLPLLTDLDLDNFTLKSIESLKNLVRLSALRFSSCIMPSSLSFLAQDDLPELATLRLDGCHALSTSSFAALSHAPTLHVLAVACINEFNNDSLQHLESMCHLRKLDLSYTSIVGDSRSLKTLMQNLFQLEELNLKSCNIGNQGAIAGALYSPHSRMRVLNLNDCNLVDDDLNGIGRLKITLEVLDLADNKKLMNETLEHCKDLKKLKTLDLALNAGIDDLSPLKECLNLEKLNVWGCCQLTDDSFKVFSEEPNSFPNLRVLNLSRCSQLTEKFFEHLSKNNHFAHGLKELYVDGMSKILSSSATTRNNLCQLKGLRRFGGVSYKLRAEGELIAELCGRLTNLEESTMFNLE